MAARVWNGKRGIYQESNLIYSVPYSDLVVPNCFSCFVELWTFGLFSFKGNSLQCCIFHLKSTLFCPMFIFRPWFQFHLCKSLPLAAGKTRTQMGFVLLTFYHHHRKRKREPFHCPSCSSFANLCHWTTERSNILETITGKHPQGLPRNLRKVLLVPIYSVQLCIFENGVTGKTRILWVDSAANPGFWSGGQQSFDPRGGPWAPFLLKIGFFPWNCLKTAWFWKKYWVPGGTPGSAGEIARE